MYDPFTLSEAERALIVELLEQEERDLPAEIHHTRTSEVKEDLRRRLDMVHRLLERMRPVAVH